MSQRITRRQLLGGGIKAGIGQAVWNELNLGQLSAFAITPASATLADDKRFQAAFVRLDQFIAAHLRDMGAPGMTLALTMVARAHQLRPRGQWPRHAHETLRRRVLPHVYAVITALPG